jgi:hypothetical protein
VSEHRPDDDDYYAPHRTELYSQGDIFRDVPLAYPTMLEETEVDGAPDDRAEDWLTAGKRRFLSGPLDFGPAMLITPTCAAGSFRWLDAERFPTSPGRSAGYGVIMVKSSSTNAPGAGRGSRT